MVYGSSRLGTVTQPNSLTRLSHPVSPIIKLYKNDLPAGLDLGRSVAIDTETMGLDPRLPPALAARP